MSLCDSPIFDDSAHPPENTSTPTQAASSTSTCTSKTTTFNSTQALPFKFPSVWSEHTTKCLSEKRVTCTPEVCKDMVHTLSVMLAASTAGAPTALDCERVANAIVAKYPFLADPFGKSQAVSTCTIV